MILDIMSSDISVAGESDFVGDSAALEVTVNPPGVAGLDFEDGNGNKWFEAGDSALLLRAVCNIPYGFGQGTGRHYIGVVWKDSLNNATIIPELAGNSVLPFPNICGDFDFPEGGLYLPSPRVGRHRLTLTVISLNVSQISLPAVLNGVTIPVQYHLEIKHTKALVGAP